VRFLTAHKHNYGIIHVGSVHAGKYMTEDKSSSRAHTVRIISSRFRDIAIQAN